VALVVTPIIRFIAYRLKLVDRPDDLLKPHGRPIAYLGGVAMCIGLLAGLAGYVFFAMPEAAGHWHSLKEALGGGRLGEILSNPLWNLLAVAVACVLITIVGLLDDIREITPKQKVYGQIAAAAVLLVGGVGNNMAKVVSSIASGPFIVFQSTPPQWLQTPPVWLLLPISAAMCIVLVIAVCNATNLLDGLDGLCSGVTGIIAAGFLALAVWLAMWGRFPGTDELRVSLCLAMAGAVFGFLPYNVPPASIFMGDAGSMLLGFFVATMMAMFCQEGNARWFLAACMVFALPILDTALAVVRRIRSGRSIFTGDRSHLYDQLVDRGMTVKQVVGLFYVLATVAAITGVLLAIFVQLRYAMALYLVGIVGAWIVFWKLGMITPPPRKPAVSDKQRTDGD